MRIRQYIKRLATLALMAAILAPLQEAWGQETTYDNVIIIHKQGMWYDTSYRSGYPRNDVSDPYGNDTFAESPDSAWIFTEFGVKMQNTHVYRVDICMEPGETRTLTLPGNMSEEHCSMYNYQRWYNYETDGFMNELSVVNGYENRCYLFENGHVGGTFIRNVANLSGNDYDKALVKMDFTMPESEKDVYYVACDVSNYTDVTEPGSNITHISEPTLSQRVIFVVYSAKYMRQSIAALPQGKYLENYTIHFPTKSIGNTAEQVALSMPAQNYFCPGENKTAGALSYEIKYGQQNSNFLTKAVNTISGEERKVPFTYRSNNAINDGDVAYINVYKTVDGERYNIARFTLIFDEHTEGIKKSIIDGLGEGDELYFRTNTYMENNDYLLLTKLNFDYENVTLNNVTYFPYPISWTYSSYGFYAGVKNESGNPQWGEYAITKNFPWLNDDNSPELLNQDGFHLYVDANERPGVICRLPFRENLCPGAMMYVTAWITSTASSTSQCDANVVFVLKGVKEDGSEEVIYRQVSGQIPFEANEWHQLYFSYPSGNNSYERYYLQIENNSANTKGADFCIDDIRVYMNPLEVHGKTLEPVCTSDAEAQIGLEINYELMLKRLGLEETDGQGTVTTGYYSFLDKSIYDRVYTGSNYEEAFSQALIHGEDVYIGSTNQYYGTIKFSNNPDENTGKDGMALLVDGSLSFISEVKVLGEGATLMPGNGYYIVYNAATFDPDNITSIEALAQAYDFESRCTVKGEFTVDGPLIVRVNGQVASDADKPCIGQVPHVTVQMKDDEGNPINATFDWYFGTLDEFNQDGSEDKSLREMLEAFRHFYPTETAISDNILPQTEGVYNLTQEDITYLKKLNEEIPENLRNPKLTLSASADLLIRLRSEETHIVLIPIGEVEGTEKVCWEPTPLVLYAQDGAPTAFVGYEGIDYPVYPVGSGVSIRMDLDQMQKVKNTPLSVPLRDPLLNNRETTLVPVPNDQVAYLAFTDDPNLAEEVGTGFDYEVAKMNAFRIDPTTEQNYVHFTFNDDFVAREGYRYFVTFRFRSEDQAGSGEEGADACYGNVVVPILIVPKYEVWLGGTTGNWNNDANWCRADRSDLNKDNDYVLNEMNGGHGFVPIYYTRIVIPEENDQIELYSPSRRVGNNSRILDLETGKDDTNIGEASNNIEYDLVVRAGESDNVYGVRPYYTNVCYEIHFEPGAEMLHAEYLYYNKAWVDYQLTGGRWYTLASPLQGVVAGDFYTDSDSGKEMQEYFTDITFAGNGLYKNGTLPNNRFKPSVYQRAWKGTGATMVGTLGGERAIAGNWSALYNDVAESYTPGTGFSLKVQDLPEPTSGSEAIAKFRLPKADESYKYYENLDDKTGEDAPSFEREDVGKLKTDVFSSGTSFTVPLQESADGQYYLVGNPFMAHLDMNAFFNRNTDLERKYWLVTDENQTAAVGSGDWITLDGATPKVAPLQSFFVQKANNETGELTVEFTQDMQVLGDGGTGDGLRSANALTITATTTDGRTSRAAVAYSGMASDDYQSSEDAELFLDSNLGDVPMVYTVAGTMASSINVRQNCELVPLGVYGARNEQVTLRFDQVGVFSGVKLYDTKTKRYTTLTDGSEVSVSTNDYGRYYLTGGIATGNEAIRSVDDISIYSVRSGEIVATSAGSSLRSVRVYGIGGELVTQQSLANQSVYRLRVPGNAIYVVYAEDMDGIIRNVKLRVR